MVECPECGEDQRLRPGATTADGQRETVCEVCGHEWLRAPEPGWREPATIIRFPRTPPERAAVAAAEGAGPYVLVPTTKLNLADVERRAVRRAERFLARGSQLNHAQLVRLNRLGVLGEDAVEHHLASLGLRVWSIAEDHLDGGEDWGDLSAVVPHGTDVGGSSWWIEVKTIGAVKWSRGVRNPVRESRSSVVVWCAAPAIRQPLWVRILGWAPETDIIGDGRTTPMRSINDLNAWMRRPWFEC